jgi:hypothetical protein
MESTHPAREWRCRRCDTLLGVIRGPWVELRYKTAHFEVRGVVRARCRRCELPNETTTEAPAAVAAAG